MCQDLGNAQDVPFLVHAGENVEAVLVNPRVIQRGEQHAYEVPKEVFGWTRWGVLTTVPGVVPATSVVVRGLRVLEATEVGLRVWTEMARWRFVLGTRKHIGGGGDERRGKNALPYQVPC